MSLQTTWFDLGREPRVAPNPAFPDGVALDVTTLPGEPSCFVELDYPARRCGYWIVECKACDLSIIITTAGRPDDPRSVRVPCKRAKH
jgi:hypothetical protein